MISNTLKFTLFYALLFLIECISTSAFFNALMKFPCYKEEYQWKRFYCKNDFFLSFRSNPFQSCTKQAKVLVDCRAGVDRQCLMEADKTSTLYKSYKEIAMKSDYKKVAKAYCHNAGLFSPFVEPDAMKRIGCSMELYIRKSTCIRDFQSKWRHNRGNKLLCKAYEAMEKCIQEAVVSHCTEKAIVKITKQAKIMMAKLIPRKNPFCEYKDRQTAGKLT